MYTRPQQWTRRAVLALLPVLLLTAGGCQATHTMVRKRNLDVQTKMSKTIFLDPVKAELRVAYLQLRNTSDKQDLEIASRIREAIAAKGFQLTDDPDEAHYWVQANVLQVGKSDLREAQQSLLGGYGAGIGGALVGVGLAEPNSVRGATAVGLLGAFAGTAMNALVEDTCYVMITDLQISERAPEGVEVRADSSGLLEQGTSSQVQVTSSEVLPWRRYQTRIVSTANKVNLKFEEALPELEKGLIGSIANVL